MVTISTTDDKPGPRRLPYLVVSRQWTFPIRECDEEEHMKALKTKFLLFLTVQLIAVTAMMAQGGGKITGYVKDPSGFVVAVAAIVLTNIQTGAKLTTHQATMACSRSRFWVWGSIKSKSRPMDFRCTTGRA